MRTSGRFVLCARLPAGRRPRPTDTAKGVSLERNSPWNHQPDERRAGEDPGDVSRVVCSDKAVLVDDKILWSEDKTKNGGTTSQAGKPTPAEHVERGTRAFRQWPGRLARRRGRAVVGLSMCTNSPARVDLAARLLDLAVGEVDHALSCLRGSRGGGRSE